MVHVFYERTPFVTYNKMAAAAEAALNHRMLSTEISKRLVRLDNIRDEEVVSR